MKGIIKAKIITKTRKYSRWQDNHKCLEDTEFSMVTSNFCPKCGEYLKLEDGEHKYYLCSCCGESVGGLLFSHVDDDSNFCSHCGAKFDK